jgi:hypothetical protein
MEATTLFLANGLTRTVKGNSADIGATLKRRTMGEDDRIRQFIDLDGETLTINADAIAMTEAAGTKTTERAFGFARALEA